MPRKNVKKAAEMKLVVRDKKTGKFSPRKRGRPSPDVEVGFLDAEGKFKPGNPRKRRRGRRGKTAVAGSSMNGARRGATSGLDEIDRIVQKEVAVRLKRAQAAAITAFDRALAL
jgi:hypothetical protein